MIWFYCPSSVASGHALSAAKSIDESPGQYLASLPGLSISTATSSTYPRGISRGVRQSPAGGVMGKVVDAQSIVIASTATNWFGHESSILRFLLVHSVVLAVLMGVLALLQPYVFPFTSMVVK